MICMPTDLIEVYRHLLDQFGMLEEAASLEEVKGLIGGASREDTLKHFTYRYGVSVCRMESIVIDPESAFASIPRDLQATFSDGRVSILDAPSGTGAAGTSILATVAVLRRADLLPKLPLTVTITAGDLSRAALEIYDQVLSGMERGLREVGITVRFLGHEWDAFKAEETSRLVDKWFENSVATEEYMAIVANFSGTASSSWEPLQRSFQHLHERLYTKPSAVLWVEPGMPGAKKLAERIRNFCRTYYPWVVSSEESYLEHQYRWYNPLQKREHPCRVIVQRFVKTRGGHNEV
jgi:hypothetical protein